VKSGKRSRGRSRRPGSLGGGVKSTLVAVKEEKISLTRRMVAGWHARGEKRWAWIRGKRVKVLSDDGRRSNRRIVTLERKKEADKKVDEHVLISK